MAVYWLKPTKLPKALEKHSGDEQTKDSIGWVLRLSSTDFNQHSLSDKMVALISLRKYEKAELMSGDKFNVLWIVYRDIFAQ